MAVTPTNPRATETILRQFVDTGHISTSEMLDMLGVGLIELGRGGHPPCLSAAGRKVLDMEVKMPVDFRSGQIREVPAEKFEQELRNSTVQQALEAEPKNTLDIQVGGDHYKKLGQYQPWQVCAACMTPEELRGYMKGTVIAYLMREQDKGGDLDIKKAAHTIQLWEEVRKDK